jgi:DNA mismatch repair protein MutS
MVTTNITDEYLDHQTHYQTKYGDKTIVVMQVGSFYEMYAVAPTQYEFLRNLTNLLGIIVTRKNKKTAVDGEPVTNSNPYMAGFNEASFSKFMKMMVTNGYTVIRIDQEANTKGNTDKLDRHVTRIYSAGTCVDDLSNTTNSGNQYLASIYLEAYDSDELSTQCRYSVGVTLLDLTTGKSLLYEYHDSNQSDASHKAGVLGTVYNLLYSYQPVETVIYHCPGSENSIKEWLRRLNYNQDSCHCRGSIDTKWINLSYQIDYLRNHYPSCGSLQPHDYLNLEMKSHATISLLMAIEFSVEHDRNIVANLPKPKVQQNDQYLEISYQTLETLDVISTRKDSKPLWDILNHCSTAIGRRELRDRLIKPITCPKQLQTRYDHVEHMKPHYEEFESKLKNIYDLDRLYRKMNLGSLRPSELGLVLESQQMTQDMWQLVTENENLTHFIDLIGENGIDMIHNIQQFQTEVSNTFRLDELLSYHHLMEIETSIFQPTVEPEIDQLEQEREKIIASINEFRHTLCLLSLNERDRKLISTNTSVTSTELINSIVDPKSRTRIDGYVKLVNNEKEGYSFKMTKSRYREYQRQTGHPDTEISERVETLTFRERSNEYNLRGKWLSSMSNELILVIDQLKKRTRLSFVEKIKQWYQKYSLCFGQNSEWISELDVIKSVAKTACKYGYVKPSLITGSGPSIIHATDLRHPIVERVYQDILFVPNDVGRTYTSESTLTPRGVVITGLNGVGKSIYIKSVALSVLMAQAGFYVPASSYQFRPYQSLLTRIGNSDNLYKGQSTFYSEMLELDYIIRTANQHTLVIADELCSGSEYYSAQAILANTIQELVKLGSTFYLTTHFHECLELPEIKSMTDDSLSFFHFSVDFSPEKSTLVYHRKLVPGIGDRLYGVEVAKFLLDKKSFVDGCFTIRQRLISGVDTSGLVISKYNTRVVSEQCQICQKTASYPGELHTHHIQEQHQANSDGLIGHIHKNNKSNLVILCCHHHRMVHGGEIEINGWTDSPSEGRQLNWRNI